MGVFGDEAFIRGASGQTGILQRLTVVVYISAPTESRLPAANVKVSRGEALLASLLMLPSPTLDQFPASRFDARTGLIQLDGAPLLVGDTVRVHLAVEGSDPELVGELHIRAWDTTASTQS
jgi:hypothetical protein